MERVVIFANGVLADPEAARGLLVKGDYLVAADGGARHLLAMGILPDTVIGDLDSVDEETLANLIAAEVEIHQYPEDKDETDLELALKFALERRPASILIVAGLGARLDQTLANLMLLTDPIFSGIDVRMDDGVEQAFFCREQVDIHGQDGDLVSLLPWGKPVEGVTTSGLKWPLGGETLFPESSRGVSNAMVSGQATISIQSGTLLVIHSREPAPFPGG